jgi:hypothetical protein
MSTTAIEPKPISSTIPARSRSPAVVAVPHAYGHRARGGVGGVIEIVVGINAERKSLESVAKPLTSVSPEPESLSS